MPDKQIYGQIDWTFHPLADIFPMLDETDLDDLAADIKAHGLREHIKLWGGAIIDGRNRFEACQIAGVEPVFKALEFPGGEPQALAYVLSRNLKRRHLTVAQRALIAAKVATMRQGARTDPAQPASRADVFIGQAEISAAILPESGGAQGKPVSQAVAAQMMNVSERSVRDAKVVLNSGNAELVKDVEAGRAPLHKAAEAVRRPGGRPEPEPCPPEEPEERGRVADRPPVPQEGDYGQISTRREPWGTTRLPTQIVFGDIVAWAAGASEADLTKLADFAFDVLPAARKLRHFEKASKWVDTHEVEARA